MATKHTGKEAATAASATLRSPKTGDRSKSAAGSALAQAGTEKKTSKEAASIASAVLRDGRTSEASKSAAGSALAQRPRAKKKR